jgi:hypothetical protein
MEDERAHTTAMGDEISLGRVGDKIGLQCWRKNKANRMVTMVLDAESVAWLRGELAAAEDRSH